MNKDQSHAKQRSGTYVYCLVADTRAPALRGVPPGPPGTGPVRLLKVDSGHPSASRGKRTLGQWLVVSDARLTTYSAPAIEQRLKDLDWVSRAAVAHEAVVERFMKATAVLPMKLLTLFSSDERALLNLREQRTTIDAAVKRVAKHDEWGIRIMLDRVPMRARTGHNDSATGSGYLKGKKALRDARTELARRSRQVVADIYDQLEAHASLGKRRNGKDLPVDGGPLLLDAAFLISRSHSARFRAAARRAVRSLEPDGYRVMLSGPWPPYSFMND